MSWGMAGGGPAGQWPGAPMGPAAGQWGPPAVAPAGPGQWGAPGPDPSAGPWGPPAAAPGYAPEQWAAMQQQQQSAMQQQQQWQQWAQWQQQYVQWQAQYGEKFAQQMQMSGMQAAGIPPLPSNNAPPAPPPPKEQPPPPPHENNQPLYGQAAPAPAPAPAVAPAPAPAPVAVAPAPAPVAVAPAPTVVAPNPTPVNQVAGPGYANNAATTSTTESLASVNAEALKKLAEEERLFDIQFKKWEDEIEKWKRENVNHPDKQAYKEYEQKFEACRVQLLERRQQMNARKARLLGTDPNAITPASNTQTPAVATDPTPAVTTAPSVQPYQNNTQVTQNVPNQGQQQQNFPNQTNQWQPSQNYSNQGNQPAYGTPTNSYQGQQYNSVSATNVNTQENTLQSSYGAYGTSDPKSFLPSSAATKGIPGLDLVQDEKPAAAPTVAATGEAGKPQGPDYTNINKGINNILGDEKIMNILQVVRGQGSATVPTTTAAPSTQIAQAATYTAPPPSVPAAIQTPAVSQTPAAMQTPAVNPTPVANQTAAVNYTQPNYQATGYQNLASMYQNASSYYNQAWNWNYNTQQYGQQNQMQYNMTTPAAQQNTYSQYGAYNQNMGVGYNQNMAATNQLGATMGMNGQMPANGPVPLMSLNPAVPAVAAAAVDTSPWADEPMFTPGIIVEYDHKPLRLKAREFIEPAQMIDYNHISKEEEFKQKDFEKEVEDLFAKFPVREPYERKYQVEPDLNYERRIPGKDRIPPRVPTNDYDGWRMEPSYGGMNWEGVHRPGEFGRDEFQDEFSRRNDVRGKDRFNRRSASREMDSRKRGRSKESDAKSDTSKKPKEPKKAEPSRVIMIDDILEPPGRDIRPPKIVIILRGPPGSGKSHLAKLIRDREAEYGGAARIMSIDDYFMQESEVEETDPATGKTVKKPTLKYQYDPSSEETYLNSLKRAFKRSITDGYFNFLIYDAINDQLKSYADIWNFARQNNFQVYVVTLCLDAQLCYERCIHERSLEDIQVIAARWFSTPAHHLSLDCSSLLQPKPNDVPMEEALQPPPVEAAPETNEVETSFTSKWEKMDDAQQLARLDGISKPLRAASLTMHDYLQLDDWQPQAARAPGKKTVRWADIEERRAQERARAVGFVVGRTDWDRMTDPTRAEHALTQTKYIERVDRN